MLFTWFTYWFHAFDVSLIDDNYIDFCLLLFLIVDVTLYAGCIQI